MLVFGLPGLECVPSWSSHSSVTSLAPFPEGPRDALRPTGDILNTT